MWKSSEYKGWININSINYIAFLQQIIYNICISMANKVKCSFIPLHKILS